MTSQIRGVVPPLAIPLKDGELDVVSLERHINRMIGAGLNGLFVSGSTGEVAFSTSERRQQIQREVVRIVDGRIPLLVGVIDTETERVIENIKAVEEIGGARGVVATAPFYALGGQAEIENHFRILKENTDLELWAYDIPVCVHTKLQNDLVLRLGKEGVLDGVKDSSGDDVGFRWLSRANEAAGHPLQLQRVASGRVQGFGAGVGAFKTALQLLGVFDSNEMPRPVKALEGANVEHVASVLREVGLLS